MQGGAHVSDFAPLSPNGNAINPANGVEYFGCHRDTTSHLNIPNPVPGWVYYWGRLGDNKRVHYETRGLFPAVPGTALIGGPAPARDPHHASAPIDSAITYGDVILLAQPEEVARHYRESIEARNARDREESGEGFVNQGLSLQQRYAQYAPRSQPLYFREADHGVQPV